MGGTGGNGTPTHADYMGAGYACCGQCSHFRFDDESGGGYGCCVPYMDYLAATGSGKWVPSLRDSAHATETACTDDFEPVGDA